MILLILAALVALLLLYALWLRDWLKAKPGAQWFFDLVEPVEIFLFRKSPTILFARLKVVTGLLLTYLTSIGGIDLSSLTPFVPEKYQPWVNGTIALMPLILSMIGGADEWLRKKTTLPIELVSVKETTAPPEVKAAIAQAEVAKVEAVAIVAEAAKAA